MGIRESESEASGSVEQTHLDLSPASKKLLDFVRDHPRASRPLDFSQAPVPDWFHRHRDPLQTWPFLIDDRKLEELSRATVGITRLVRDIPRTIFDDDPGKVAEFFGMEDELLASLLLIPPTGLESSLARCDFVDSEQGLRCVEVNLGAFLGGWELRFLLPFCLDNPPIKEFLTENDLEPRYRDPFEGLMRHLAVDVLAGSVVEGDEIHIVFAVDQEALEPAGTASPYFNELFAELLQKLEIPLRGRISICSYPGPLEAGEGMRIFLDGRPVHAVVEYARSPTPREIYYALKAERVKLYNGPVSHYFSDKRILALLSESAASDRFSEDEKAILRDHLPWSRLVRDVSTDFENEAYSLPSLLRQNRRRFVLKPGLGSRGERVQVGYYTPPAEWERCLEEALADGRWVVQEYVRSRPYLCQHGECGQAVYQAVWGTFCFGDRYGGGFLRLLPGESSDGVINTARGAFDGVILEV